MSQQYRATAPCRGDGARPVGLTRLGQTWNALAAAPLSATSRIDAVAAPPPTRRTNGARGASWDKACTDRQRWRNVRGSRDGPHRGETTRSSTSENPSSSPIQYSPNSPRPHGLRLRGMDLMNRPDAGVTWSVVRLPRSRVPEAAHLANGRRGVSVLEGSTGHLEDAARAVRSLTSGRGNRHRPLAHERRLARPATRPPRAAATTSQDRVCSPSRRLFDAPVRRRHGQGRNTAEPDDSS